MEKTIDNFQLNCQDYESRKDIYGTLDELDKKAEYINAIGNVIAHLGSNNDQTQALEWHGEKLGMILADFSEDIINLLTQQRLLLSGRKTNSTEEFSGSIEAANG